MQRAAASAWALVGLAIAPAVAQISSVPPDQCLGGTLRAVQQDSITLQFNQKIIRMPVAPDAEIWRRGVDLKSVRELIPGDELYLRCTRAASGAVHASVVAAVEKTMPST